MTKIVIIIIVAIICILTGIFSTIILLNIFDSPKIQISDIKNEADILKEQGIEAYEKGDYQKAKKLLNEARTKYESVNDDNNIIDIDSILNLIRIQEAQDNTPVTSSVEAS